MRTIFRKFVNANDVALLHSSENWKDLEGPLSKNYIQAPCFHTQDQCLACWDKLARNSVVKLNHLQAAVGRFHSSMHKRGLALSPNYECSALNKPQTTFSHAPYVGHHMEHEV